MNILESLNWRYATKSFDPTKKVSDKDLQTILEAMRLTPSSFGLQFWKFVVVTNQALKEKLVEHSWNQRQVADCSHLLILCRPIKVTTQDVDSYVSSITATRGVSVESLQGYAGMMKGFIENTPPEKLNAWMEKQIYIALGILHETCALLQIDSCPMEGFVAGSYNEILGLTAKNWHATVVCPIGYRSAEDKYAELKKVRYPLAQVVEWIK